MTNRVRRFEHSTDLRRHATNPPYPHVHDFRIRLIHLEKLPRHLTFPWPPTFRRSRKIYQPQGQHPELPQEAGKMFPYFFPSVGVSHASPRVLGKASDTKPGNVGMNKWIRGLQETVQVDALRTSNALQEYLHHILFHAPGGVFSGHAFR
ncbi:hypothetical protein, unlikely [Trypanosoma congolense IL3000]|uniref:Uncharacterized protein n=1 Tax=Trypanosoma congolense (strain IL3000) TaxID=1068625 RepID=F9WAJ7_TRYCI|nr:hypothetical protein, unlikely [Trypanosoma congolense IL3000]